MTITIKNSSERTQTNFNENYNILVKTNDTLMFSFMGMKTKEIKVKKNDKIINVKPEADNQVLEEIVIAKYEGEQIMMNQSYVRITAPPILMPINTESYTKIDENGFLQINYKPLSTFFIDVDKPSYSNMRRMNNGEEIPKDAIKTQELINYFSYDYKQPKGKEPFSIKTSLNKAPWNDKHKLVKIGLQGKIIPTENVPPSNLVFLIDVSGSMQYQDKLPLLKSAFKLLVNQLRAENKVSIVVYAIASGLVLPPTSGKDKTKILEALNKLETGGSTAGGAALELAYKTAEEQFIKKGNNRVILPTDDDSNVGASSDKEMEELIEEKVKVVFF